MDDNQTVFIVDDDEAVRDSLAALLTSVDLETRTFSSGDSFLNAVNSVDAGLDGCVILDVRMPGLSGLEIQERLAGRKNFLPVIIVTGHGDLPMAVKAMKAGAIDFIEKPFDDAAMIACVRNALNRSAQTREEVNLVSKIERGLARLTARERDVLNELVIGNLNKIIAHNLGISSRTVEVHRARVMEKMQARNLAHLVRLAITAGVLPEASN